MSPVGRCWLALVCYAAAGVAFADTGPEYLEDEPEQDPISSAFEMLRLPFEEDRKSLLHLRTFYQDRSFTGLQGRENWAGGGWLNVIGSFWQSRITLAGTMYTSQKLYDDNDKGETGALQPVHQSYSQLGEVYASLALDQVALQAGRYAMDLPYINSHDIRMTPRTFEAAQAIYEVNEGWEIGAGYVSKIKRRTREGFDPLYEAAGLDENKDVPIAGSFYEFEPGTYAGTYLLHAPEFYNGAYIEASKRFHLDDERHVQLSGQYTYQDATGDNLDGDFNVHHYGARITWKDGWYSGSLAYTDYPEEDRLRKPWGGIPGYTSVLINDFDREEESAWLLGGTVDFDTLGARGFSVNAKAIFGDTPDCGASASPDQDEYNLNLRYSPPVRKLEGLVLQLRFGWVERDDTCARDDGVDVNEIRFVANFPINF